MTRTLTVAVTRDELKASPGEVGLVMTMGALHAGHAALIRAARERNDTVIVTIFVNPLQFGPAEDFGRYPRTLEADLELCADEGADIVFAPSHAEVYRGANHVTVHPGQLSNELEGASRPGHFAGVLTVVNKLLHIVPGVDRAYFGEKDYQQLVLIQAMATDFDMSVQIVGRPTVREADGLALSSRNRYLGPAERAAAVALPDALFAGAAAAADGADALGVLAAADAVLHAASDIAVDYLELRSPALGAVPAAGPARLLAAVKVGNTRLIDNVAISLKEPSR